MNLQQLIFGQSSGGTSPYIHTDDDASNATAKSVTPTSVAGSAVFAKGNVNIYSGRIEANVGNAVRVSRDNGTNTVSYITIGSLGDSYDATYPTLISKSNYAVWATAVDNNVGKVVVLKMLNGQLYVNGNATQGTPYAGCYGFATRGSTTSGTTTTSYGQMRTSTTFEGTTMLRMYIVSYTSST
jgi:hypothetical protein